MNSLPVQQQDAFYMQRAYQQARLSFEYGEFPVGCVLVFRDEIVAEGSRQNSGGIAADTAAINELDHAEIVAIRRLYNLRQKKERDIDFGEITLYSTLEPCLMCYSALLINGISRIVYAYEDVMGGGTKLALDRLPPLYSKLKIEIVSGVMREKSLDLFKQYFSLNKNSYLRDSYLARYTLLQE